MSSPVIRLGIVALFLAGVVRGQEPAAESPEDWREVVRTAVEHARFAVRRAAAGKVARAGDVAVPALLAYEEDRGSNALPLELVEAIGGAEQLGAEVRQVLERWARDRRFYWRAQALDALARHPTESTRRLCETAVNDPSWLFRVAGARGLVTSPLQEHGTLVHGLLDDPDPRVRVRVALMLLEQGEESGLRELASAFARIDARFLDDPWGRREALFVVKELRRITGEDFGEALDEGARGEAGPSAFLAWARTKRPDLGEPQPPPTIPECRGGIEVRSCMNGDLFLRLTADGAVLAGLDPVRRATIPSAELDGLTAGLGELVGRQVHGRVVCDFLRVYWPATAEREDVHHKAAPDALPAPLAEWLKAFARALEKGDSAGLDRELESRLTQFVDVRKE